MQDNCFHFLLSFTFTSKHLEFKQLNSVMVKPWNYLQAEKHTLILEEDDAFADRTLLGKKSQGSFLEFCSLEKHL